MKETSDLRSFLKENEDEIIRIREPLSPKYEIPAALHRFDGGKALLFENPKDTDARIVGGVCGTRNRILKGMGLTTENLYEEMIKATKNPVKCKIGDGPVREVVEKGGLRDVPVLTHFKGDPGPYITSGIVYTSGPDGEHENVSFHRLLVLDDK
ncbi:UbiD family decarboxylase, partial [Candidatus Bathyarchaeota archaeon]|nr:UbiD family decarboxylase [Candidatus Bathyarchaeota archaeon]